MSNVNKQELKFTGAIPVALSNIVNDTFKNNMLVENNILVDMIGEYKNDSNLDLDLDKI